MQIRKLCFLIEIPLNNWDFLGKKYRILKVVQRELGSDLSPATISWDSGHFPLTAQVSTFPFVK